MADSQSPSNSNDARRPSEAERPRLTEKQKKANHIRSEQKRREAIRDGFDRLADITPGMEGQGRSEAVVLEGTLEYMRAQIGERQKLVAEAKARGLDTTEFELQEETILAYEAQKRRNEEHP